jgi:hypothetical protein
MKTWMLTQFHSHPTETTWAWPVAASYADGHVAPRHPDNALGGAWGLVQGECGPHHIAAAEQDPRVQPYRTVWDTITPETVRAYASQGAQAGMMLCQLLSLLAKTEPAFAMCG